MKEEEISFEQMLNESMEKSQHLDKIVTGTVIKISEDGEIFVDINYKADGIIPKNEYSFDESVNPSNELRVGDKITAEVIKRNDGQGNVLLSCKKLKSKLIKDELENIYKNGDIIEEKVSQINDNGLIVNYKGTRIFIPNSLSANQKDIIRFKIIEFNPAERKIVGSAKIVLDEEKQKIEKEFWDNAKVGDEFAGVVSSVCSYGAFVEINGVQGLLHISEMSWDKNATAQSILKEGQRIKVSIKNLDIENKRIQLSYDGKGKNPWEELIINIGDIVKVKIVKLVQFGAFAEIQKGVEGLIHISQISSDKILKPEEKLEVGEIVNAKVIDLDLENKKIELSIKEIEGTSNEYSSKD